MSPALNHFPYSSMSATHHARRRSGSTLAMFFGFAAKSLMANCTPYPAIVPIVRSCFSAKVVSAL